MSNLNSIQKALDSVKKKSEEINTLKRTVSNIENKGNDDSLFCGDVYIYGGHSCERVQLNRQMLESLFSKELVVTNANQRIEKLSAELIELKSLLDAFGKAMEPILKEQKQC